MHKLFVTIILCLFLQASPIAAQGAVRTAGELEIQAAFLVKFTSYVKWPPGTFISPDAPIIIGIFGRDPFGSIIDNIARSYVMDGRHVEIRRCRNLKALCNSQIVFIVPSAMAHINDFLSAVAGRPVLLVGNSPGFLDKVGMINFVKIGKKVRFDISKVNCDKAGFEISSKLLKVAHAVIR